VSSEDELSHAINTISTSKEAVDKKAMQFIEQNKGATNRIYSAVYS
jgi:hypothetical protein